MNKLQTAICEQTGGEPVSGYWGTPAKTSKIQWLVDRCVPITLVRL